MQSAVVLVQCPDRKGLVAAVSAFFYERGFSLLHCQQHTDLEMGQFFMRVKLDLSSLAEYAERVINIHHAFLPAFQGARPYQRAYERGVKMIGATAHYATADLDEGPIIEQDVERVTHEDSPEELSRIGRDVERIVLARAVVAHLEHRIIVAGRRAIVFSTGV